MTRKDALTLVAAALNQQPGTIAEDTPLLGLPAWDSLSMLDIIVTFDRNFKVVISPEALTKCRTAADLLNLVKNQLV